MRIKKPELVDNWQQGWKFLSVQLGLAGTSLTAWLIANPEICVEVWQALPAELRDRIPADYMPLIGVAVFVLGLVGRFLKQQNVRPSGEKT